MGRLYIPVRPLPVSRETSWRHRFSILAVITSVALIAWGGLVTSIDAGLAVPDWPTSFGSYDPFQTGFQDPTDPSAQWWQRLPILAEHGHRLLGALVGLLTVILALWTWRADPRRWMRLLGFGALALVILQGILGGLRVIWVSLDLAVVHACLAQIFFSLLVAMMLFTSRRWLEANALPPASPALSRLNILALSTVGALFVQIILGALLRHPGTGVDPLFAGIHITGALVVTILVVMTCKRALQHFSDFPALARTAWVMLGLIAVQVVLGFSAYLVLVVETLEAQRSVLQIVLNSAHLVVGALLMASTVIFVLQSLRRPVPGEVLHPEAVAAHAPISVVGA